MHLLIDVADRDKPNDSDNYVYRRRVQLQLLSLYGLVERQMDSLNNMQEAECSHTKSDVLVPPQQEGRLSVFKQVYRIRYWYGGGALIHNRTNDINMIETMSRNGSSML